MAKQTTDGRYLQEVTIVDAEGDDLVIEASGGMPVAIQDQTTTPLDFYFVKIKGAPTTLDGAITAVAPTTFVYEFDVVNAANFSVGDYAGIFQNSTVERYFFAEVKDVTDETITVDTPLDFNFEDGVTVASFDRNMNVDGSVTPQIFQVEVGPNSMLSIDLNRVMTQMKTSIAPTLALFGDLARLEKGTILRIVRANGLIQNIWTVKDNAQMSLHAFDVEFYTSVGQGQEGLAARSTFNGQDKRGVAIRLAPGDKLQTVIQDNLLAAQSSAQITEFFRLAEGHVVIP